MVRNNGLDHDKIITIQAYFTCRMIFKVSLEHDSAYMSISPPICTNRLIFSKSTVSTVFFLDMLTNPIIFQLI